MARVWRWSLQAFNKVIHRILGLPHGGAATITAPVAFHAQALSASSPFIAPVALHTPSHSGVGDLLSYACDRPLPPGTLVRVPLGNREVLGVVWDSDAATGELPDGATLRAVKATRRRQGKSSGPWARWHWPPCRPSCAT